MDASRAKICDKKLKAAELKLNKILCKIDLVKLNNYDISRLDLSKKKEWYRIWFLKDRMKKSGIIGTILVSLILGVWLYYFESNAAPSCLRLLREEGAIAIQDIVFLQELTDLSKKKEWYRIWFLKDRMKKSGIIGTILVSLILGVWLYYFESNAGCFLPLPQDSKTLFRSPEDCSMCIGVNDVTRLANITAEEFEKNYAYTTKPVIITDATTNWKAIKEFSFEFFANFYRKTKMGRKINDCFYFAYKSGINSLDEVFEMDDKRANLTGEPWYVGWSTCYEEETRALRQYYKRPYFLPKTAESDMVDWIFMGGPGQGAHMHVDSVRHMSWQAQVRGHKRWDLAPPPECLYACRWLAFTVHPGEILVVDTNRWYHKTNVLPGDISITIGAEYD